MAPSSKNAGAAKDRRKSSTVTAAAPTSNGTNGHSDVNGATTPGKHVITLRVTPKKLRAIVDPGHIEEDTPSKDGKEKESPATSTTLPGAANSHGENGSDSNSNTPAGGTPAPVPMGPPTEGPKKKGNKRTAGAMNGEPKVRGKPGPKKKLRLEDGTPVETGRGTGLAAHKLGPKANMGAINAGLRALDRSGKPCRKWARSGFTLKSFTGVVWEISRWSAPPKYKPEAASAEESGTVSAEGSSKENKDGASQVKSEVSNNGGDIEMQSGAPSVAAANSPAPVPIAAA